MENLLFFPESKSKFSDIHKNGNSEELLADIKTEDPDSGILDEFEDNDMVGITFVIVTFTNGGR